MPSLRTDATNLIEREFMSSVRGTIVVFKANLTFVFKRANWLASKIDFSKIL
jgi:hypothetical protein